MEYDLNQIADPKRFQRLLNAILIARFGEDARLTPLRGPDGGSDGETAPSNPYMEFRHTDTVPRHMNHPLMPPRPGRYLFQAKYHPTGDQRPSDLRSLVIREFEDELTSLLSHPDHKDTDYFFLVTNVPASKSRMEALDEIRRRLLARRGGPHADIWWGERITAFLDWSPQLWHTFSEVFPGGVPRCLPRPYWRVAKDWHGTSGSPFCTNTSETKPSNSDRSN